MFSSLGLDQLTLISPLLTALPPWWVLERRISSRRPLRGVLPLFHNCLPYGLDKILPQHQNTLVTYFSEDFKAWEWLWNLLVKWQNPALAQEEEPWQSSKSALGVPAAVIRKLPHCSMWQDNTILGASPTRDPCNNDAPCIPGFRGHSWSTPE